MAAEINKARRDGTPQRTVADFIADFRGLSGTAKRRDICEAVGATRESLETFFARGDGAIGQLLAQMKAQSRPVKPSDLGIIGKEHVLHMVGGAPSAQQYKKDAVDVDGVPYLIECGFGYRPEGGVRMIIAALNWSAPVNGNPFQRLSYQSLGSILTEQRAGPDEPIAFFLHVATPRATFLDKGKSIASLPYKVNMAIIAATRHVTDGWCRQRKAEEKDKNAERRRLDAMTAKSKPMSLRAAAFSVMPEAYAKASDNGRLPANARQIFYAARGELFRLTERSDIDGNSFTQGPLVDYMNEYPEQCSGWDVVFDDRGHLTEPHTERKIGLGTLEVRNYVLCYAKPRLVEGSFAGAEVSTSGPEGRYGSLAYIEKQGLIH